MGLDVSHGGWDFFVVKLNSSGVIQWQKNYGGTSDDVATSVTLGLDSGYVVSGYSFSNNGDVSGNHGGSDIWIVKMNILGQTQWTRTIGGASSETPVSYYYNTDGSFLIVSNTTSNNGDAFL